MQVCSNVYCAWHLPAQVRKSGDFWGALDGQVDLVSNTDEKNRREYMHSGRRVRDKIEDARRNYSDVLRSKPDRSS